MRPMFFVTCAVLFLLGVIAVLAVVSLVLSVLRCLPSPPEIES